MRAIKSIEEKYLQPALELVDAVFTASESAEDGALVRKLVEEIRSKRFYLPELELIMVDDTDEIIGYCMFARFHLEGKHEDELLLLSPVAWTAFRDRSATAIMSVCGNIAKTEMFFSLCYAMLYL